jgi:hypothetical protein
MSLPADWIGTPSAALLSGNGGLCPDPDWPGHINLAETAQWKERQWARSWRNLSTSGQGDMYLGQAYQHVVG